jgi:hypothetical protein
MSIIRVAPKYHKFHWVLAESFEFQQVIWQCHSPILTLTASSPHALVGLRAALQIQDKPQPTYVISAYQYLKKKKWKNHYIVNSIA